MHVILRYYSTKVILFLLFTNWYMVVRSIYFIYISIDKEIRLKIGVALSFLMKDEGRVDGLTKVLVKSCDLIHVSCTK